jgi:hypothetical protein
MPPRRRRPRVNRHFKIDHELRPGDREAYLAHLREPRITIDLAHAWLRDKVIAPFPARGSRGTGGTTSRGSGAARKPRTPPPSMPPSRARADSPPTG